MLPKWARSFDWVHLQEKATQHGLDPDLVAAVIQTESGGNTFAVRYEPDYRYVFQVDHFAKKANCSYASMLFMQKTSWGLMQVMGGVALEYGLAELENRFHRTPAALIDPEIGLEFGCRVLARKFEQFGPGVATVVAGYNAGTPRKDATGQFLNHVHVSRFMRYYRELKGIE